MPYHRACPRAARRQRRDRLEHDNAHCHWPERYAARGNARLDQEKWDTACADLERALEAYRESEGQECLLLPNPSFEAHNLLLLADCAVHLGSAARARRFVLVAKRLGRERELPLILAYSELILGRIDDQEGAADRALQRFRHAASMAARDDNQKVAFAAEFEVFCQARRAGDSARARASARRLERLAPWVPPHTPALRKFKTLKTEDRASIPHSIEGDVDVETPNPDRAGTVARARTTAHSQLGKRRAPAAIQPG